MPHGHASENRFKNSAKRNGVSLNQHLGVSVMLLSELVCQLTLLCDLVQWLGRCAKPRRDAEGSIGPA